MKKLIVALMIGLICLVGVSRSEAVIKVVRGQAACDTTASGCSPIPLTVTTLCVSGVGSCAQATSFSFTNPSRFWGATNGQCRMSTNGGGTWGNCTTNPFAGAATTINVAGAADGSVIAIGRLQTPSRCAIARSTDNTTSWTTVFSTSVNYCDPGGVEGQYLYCFSNGDCEASVFSANTTFQIYRSGDNGTNWVAGETASAFCSGGNGGAVTNGVVGINGPNQTGCGGGNNAHAFVSVGGDTWVNNTIAWTGTQGDCWGPIIYNSVPRQVCNTGTNYQVRNSTGALVSTITLPGASVLMDTGGISIAPFTNILYTIATVSATSKGGIWVSQDNLNTFILLNSFTANLGIRGGNMFYVNSCIYFTAGGTQPVFGKIC